MLCLHEPSPSRIFKIYSNLYINNKIHSDTIINTFIKSRKRIIGTKNIQTYVESNNFIFGCIPALNKHFSNISIIHIARHPLTYIESHLNHGFWKGKKKLVAKHVPYWLENLTTPSQYRNDPIILLAERWRYVNERIASYASSNPYLFVKFEDLFCKNNQEYRYNGINTMRSFLQCKPISDKENASYVSHPSNTSRVSKGHPFNIKEGHILYLKENMHDMLANYGYTLP